ncbi:hypothetical protein J5N97_018823 [Dioscorea zingiberensis]|uniref:Uncharacterized protein n=1 Tax=Dioscorea zingiberensis TaxID=325984 RepID=A0A9D5HBV4_9LILI|nr:hypothetical protein J5N97_018823 [Dioscorea zingiberensis]
MIHRFDKPVHVSLHHTELPVPLARALDLLHLFSQLIAEVLMEDSYTVQISSNLVNRLVRNENKPKKKTRKLKPKLPNEPQHMQHTVEPTPSSPKGNLGGGWPLQPPMFLPATPPPPATANAELEAIRSALIESEGVLQKLEKQEDNMTRELTQRAKELHDKEFKLPYQKPMPCVAEKEACLECYKKYGKEPLKCAQVVKSFAHCARQARQQGCSTPNA